MMTKPPKPTSDTIILKEQLEQNKELSKIDETLKELCKTEHEIKPDNKKLTFGWLSKKAKRKIMKDAKRDLMQIFNMYPIKDCIEIILKDDQLPE
jgi:hypothetical protein